jgi:hypothetical protein
MSIKVMTEVWESSSTKGGSRLVLLALADFANDEGYCFPSLERIALKSALSKRNVQMILCDLNSRGELVIVHGAGRGNVNAYWVLPPASKLRLTQEGKNTQNFHPFARLEEKVKSTTEKVKSDAQKVKSATKKVKPTSPRTIKNHHELSRTITLSKVETKEPNQNENNGVPQDLSWDIATKGDTQRVSAGSATRAWATLLETQPKINLDWLEIESWNRWLNDLNERGKRVTTGRLEEQLKKLQELSDQGEPQRKIVARAIAGSWGNFYPTREQPNPNTTAKTEAQDERYGRYR